jgi:hypothetical protein
VAEDETLCPHCERMTRTILGGCPNCGGPKENPVYFEPQIAPGGSWLDDFPLLRYAFWSTPVILVCAVLVLLSWEFALGLLALLAALAYAAQQLGLWN